MSLRSPLPPRYFSRHASSASASAAECSDVPICVQAYVPINFVVKIGYASEPIFVTIKK